MQGIHLRKYGVAATIPFVLYEVDGVDFRTDWTPAAGDVFMMRDEANEEQVTNAAGNADLSTLVTDEGRGYSITLALEDMQAARVVIFLVDQATKAFLDWPIIIETYGHASAQHLHFPSDLTHVMGTILTEGGSGRLAAAIIKLFDVVTPTLVASSVMRGTDSAALASAYTAARGAYLDELAAANLPTDVAAIPTTAMRGTDNANTTVPDAAGVVPTAAEIKTAIEAGGSHLTLIKAITDALPDSGALNNLATLESRLTAARAGYLDELAAANIPADVDTLKGYCDILDHATNGLANIKSLIDAIKTKTDGLNFTSTNVHAHTKATDVGGDATLANQTAIKAVTDLINGLLEDSGGYRYTAKALEEAPSGAGLTSDQNTALILIRDIMEGDAIIDIGTTPWQLVIKKKGTSTEVVKKDLKDVAGVNLAAITTVVGQQLEPS